MASGWNGPCECLQFAVVEDKKDHAKFKMERQGLGDFKKLEYNVTFDEAQRNLKVRVRKGNDLYGFDYVIKGLIKTTNLAGGLKKKDNCAFLQIDKDLRNGEFKLTDH